MYMVELELRVCTLSYIIPPFMDNIDIFWEMPKYVSQY